MNHKNNSDNNALIVASTCGSFNDVDFLIKSGADCNCVNMEGENLLMIVTKNLFDPKHYVNSQNKNSNVKNDELVNDYFKIIELLIQSGINVNHVNNISENILMFVLRHKFDIFEHYVYNSHNYKNTYIKLFDLLIKSGVDFNFQDKDGLTALMYAVLAYNLALFDENQSSYFIALKLLSNSYKFNLRSKPNADSKGLVNNALTVLIDRHDNVPHQNRKYKGIQLFNVSKSNNLEITELLIKSGADVNLQTITGNTALTLAIALNINNFELIELLVKSGADINHQTIRGNAGLFLASLYGNNEFVKFLLNLGANIHHTDENGDTILFNIINYIVKHPELKTLEGILTEEKAIDTMKLLIASGADIHHQNNDSDTPLTIALKYNLLDVIKLLIDSGADINHQNDSATVLTI